MTESERPAGPRGPELPRPRWTWPVIVYAIYGAGVLLWFLGAGLWGWSLDRDERETLPGSVRHASGGYRSHSIWHSGYHGGK